MSLTLWSPESLASVSGLRNGVTLRDGGVSAGPLASLNLSFRVGDEADAVRENRRMGAAALGFAISDIICAEQVHGGAAAVVGREDRGRGATDFESVVRGVDALITQERDIALMLLFADCFPVLLCDPVRQVVAVAHAGWRGAVDGVVENTIATMVATFGTRTENLRAAIGPGIGACCFEVGTEVAARFPEDVVSKSVTPHVDLASDLRRRVLETGILPEHLSRCADCTSCHPDRYFSHRRDAGKTGRIAAIIGWEA